MKKLFVLLTLILLFPHLSIAEMYRLRATCTEQDGTPAMFTTWRVFENDSTAPLLGNVTGQDGLIDTDIPAAGNYRLGLVGLDGQYLNMTFAVSAETPVADLGTLVLTPADSTNVLNEVVVTAQKPLVVKEIDRIAYDVLADPDVATSQLSDILRKVPMVTVEPDGTIKVNGSSDFKIYKNGRPNKAYTNNAKDLFKAIPASSIKKIEVITEPGAREDAEGVSAILNIVTNTDTSLSGVVGNVSLWLDSNNAVPTPNLWLSSQLGKVNFAVNFGYWNLNRRESQNDASTDISYIDSGNSAFETELDWSKTNAVNGGVEISYEPDTLNLITAEFDTYWTGSSSDLISTYQMNDSKGNPLFSYDSSSKVRGRSYFDMDAAVNYQRSTRLKDETITLSYAISSNANRNPSEITYDNMFNMPVGYTGINSLTRQRLTEHTFQLDWTRPFGKHTFDTGAKYIMRRSHARDRREYVGVAESYDDFKHTTDIGAVYADARFKFGKFGLRAGFRYEYSRLGAKFIVGDGNDFHSTINDYVPNASLSYSPGEVSTFKLSYGRRISRPGISSLDPAVVAGPTVTSTGNPHLKSAGYNNISFNYSMIKPMFNLDFTARYSFSSNTICQVMKLIDDHQYMTMGNVGRSHNVSGSLYFQWTPGEKTTLSTNLYCAYIHMYDHDAGADMKRFIYNPNIFLQQKLPCRFRLSVAIGYWSGGAQSMYSYIDPGIAFFWNNFRIQRSFLKDDRLNLSLGLRNPFGPYVRSYKYISESDEYKSVSHYRHEHNFSVSFSVQFRFGSLSASVKKTNKTINNDDLQSSESHGK